MWGVWLNRSRVKTKFRIGEQMVYPLLPWKWIGGGLTLVTMLAVYADELQRLTGCRYRIDSCSLPASRGAAHPRRLLRSDRLLGTLAHSCGAGSRS